MPKYRAYRYINERSATTYDFEAVSDAAAIQTSMAGDNLDWSMDAYTIYPDVRDEVLGLDLIKDDGGLVTVRDEISLPGEMPYGRESKVFVEEVADLAREGAYDDAIETLDALIRRAMILCGREGA